MVSISRLLLAVGVIAFAASVNARIPEKLLAAKKLAAAELLWDQEPPTLCNNNDTIRPDLVAAIREVLPAICPNPKSKTCLNKCMVQLSSFMSHCYTHDGAIGDLTCAAILGGQILQWAYQLSHPDSLSMCEEVCKTDLNQDLRVESHYLKPTTSFHFTFDGKVNQSLRVEQYSYNAHEMCCGVIDMGCIGSPVCTVAAEGGWHLKAAPVNATAPINIPETNPFNNATLPNATVPLHNVECGERGELGLDYDKPIDIIVPVNKKIFCWSNCDLRPIPPVCDHLVEVAGW